MITNDTTIIHQSSYEMDVSNYWQIWLSTMKKTHIIWAAIKSPNMKKYDKLQLRKLMV